MLATAIRDLIESRFQDTSNNVVSAQQWLDYMNEAYQEVNQAYPDWPWMKATSSSVVTVAGTNDVVLPADVYAVSTVYDLTTDAPLQQLHANPGDYYSTNAESRSAPKVWRMRGNLLQVWPTPDAVYTLKVEYIVAPADLGASDEPVWPEHFQRTLLTDGSLAKAYEDDGNKEWADRHLARFVAGIERLRAWTLQYQGGYHVIQDDWGY